MRNPMTIKIVGSENLPDDGGLPMRLAPILWDTDLILGYILLLMKCIQILIGTSTQRAISKSKHDEETLTRAIESCPLPELKEMVSHV